MQLVLPFTRDEDSLREYLCRITGREIFLIVTDNSTSMISVRGRGHGLSVRLHRMFLKAETDVLAEIAAFIRNRKGRTPLIRMFIRENSVLLKKHPPRRSRLRTEGRYHDLHAAYRRVNEEYFGSRISAAVTWGTVTRGRARRRTLGSYSSRTSTIRISPVLDKKNVPDYFIEFILYHEMLHADMGVRNINGRRSVHSREFRQRERMFRNYERAMAWERNMYIM